MNQKPKESDWKKYSALIPELKERYLKRVNWEIAKQLTDPEKEATESFWDSEEKIKKEARVLRDSLGYFARSRMEESILKMCRNGMMKKEDLEGFSGELKARIREILEWNEQ